VAKNSLADAAASLAAEIKNTLAARDEKEEIENVLENARSGWQSAITALAGDLEVSGEDTLLGIRAL